MGFFTLLLFAVDHPKQQPKHDDPIDENQQDYIIAESQLDKFNITYSAEIQGIQWHRSVSP